MKNSLKSRENPGIVKKRTKIIIILMKEGRRKDKIEGLKS
uniref:Uncharacterized protein n=1 Tax=Saccharolobus solfataricus (strain 98/2) TaxID=555311 RepID=D0KPR3_SACS9